MSVKVRYRIKKTKMALKTVFVTVGTTKFDKLIQTVLTSKVLKTLKQKGCSQLILQVGHGKIEYCDQKEGISIETFGLRDSIDSEIASADLIISHAGAGTCLAALNAGKPLVVVINDNLMNNHQVELAEKLTQGGYVFCANCSNLCSVLDDMELCKLNKFPKGTPQKFVEFIDSVMGF